MKSSISGLSSYIFMASLVALAVSAFAIVIIVTRNFFGTISKTEIEMGYRFLTIFYCFCCNSSCNPLHQSKI